MFNTIPEIFMPTASDTNACGYQLGQQLAKALQNKLLPLPFLITLSGEMGAGKTTFCRSLGEALGVNDPSEIVSPTFTLANEYQGMVDIFHLDLYRLPNEDQFYEAGLDEYLTRPGLAWVEWPDKLPAPWPRHRLDINLTFADQGRCLTIAPCPAPDVAFKIDYSQF